MGGDVDSLEKEVELTRDGGDVAGLEGPAFYGSVR